MTAPSTTPTDDVIRALTASPGMSLGVLRRAVGLPYAEVGEIVTKLLAEDRVWFRESERGLKFWFVKDQIASGWEKMTRAAQRTILSGDKTLNVWQVDVVRSVRAVKGPTRTFLFTKQYTEQEAVELATELAQSLDDNTSTNNVRYITYVMEHEVISKETK